MPDALTDRLAALETKISQATRLVPVAQVRRRGDRRRARSGRAAVLAAMVALTGGAGIALSGGGATGPGPNPGPTAGPASTLPAQLRLPHEGQPGWRLRTDADAPSAFQPCSPGSGSPREPAVTLNGRTAARTASGPIAPGEAATLAEQVLVYASVDLAGGAMRELMEDGGTCGWDGPASVEIIDGAPGNSAIGGWISMALRRVTAQISQGFAVPTTSSPSAGSPAMAYELALARRTGNVVVIVYSRHAAMYTDTGPQDASLAALVGQVCSLMRQCDTGPPVVTESPWPTPAPEPS